MSEPILSVVIPVREPDYAKMRRCLASFAALQGVERIEVVIVYTGEVDGSQLELVPPFHTLKIINCEERGIYPAFNAGVSAAAGKFLLFFGHDDIALPDMGAAMELLAGHSSGRVLLAGGVYVQGVGLRRPTWLKQGIVFRNWPHQGIFYSADLLSGEAYDSSFVLRADHRLNIHLLADSTVTVERTGHVVSYFSRGGFSTFTTADEFFDREQAAIAAAEFGLFWGAAVRVFVPFIRTVRRCWRKFGRTLGLSQAQSAKPA